MCHETITAFVFSTIQPVGYSVMETEFTDANKPIVGQYTKMVSNRKSTTAQITRVAYALR